MYVGIETGFPELKVDISHQVIIIKLLCVLLDVCVII